MTDHDFSRWRPHPWHGLDLGVDSPRIVNAYIEITPFDMIKYEIDKVSGYLRVDRPQRSYRIRRRYTASFRKPTVARASRNWRPGPSAVMAIRSTSA